MAKRKTTITFDANRVSYPTQTRFNAAWLEMSGQKVRLLPQTAFETMGGLMNPLDLETDRERRREDLERHERYATPRETLALRIALWWADELTRKDSPYEVIALTREQRERAEEICQEIDPSAFPRVRPEEVATHSDTIIIAQALASAQDMLITGNMRSILHDDVTHWAEQNAARFAIEKPRVLYVQDEAMTSLFTGPEGRAALCEIAIAAAWPKNSNASFDQVEAGLLAMLEACDGARLGDTAKKIGETWRTSNDRNQMVEHARARLPNKMRASERRHPTFVPEKDRQASMEQSRSHDHDIER